MLFEEKSELKHELINGNLFEMRRVSIFHNDIFGNLYLLFRTFSKGRDWKVAFENFKIKTADRNFFYADIAACFPTMLKLNISFSQRDICNP